MVERDVVLSKVATIDRCLRRIEEARDPERGLDPLDAEDLGELCRRILSHFGIR